MAGPSDSNKPPLSQNSDSGLHMKFIPENIADDKEGIRQFGVFNPIKEIKKSEGELQQPNPDSNIPQKNKP